MAEGITIDEPVKVEAPKVPTRDELKSQGWTAKELESAEKRGMISKPEDKPEPKAEEKAPEAKTEEKPQEPAPEPKKSTLPDYKFTPEEEAIVSANFGKGHPFRAFYFRAKNERHARQAAEAKARELEAQIAALKTAPAPAEDADLENQPLTLAMLKKMREQEAIEAAKYQELNAHKAEVLRSAQTEQEEFARANLPDFDDTVEKAKELIQNLDSLVPEKWKQAKAVTLFSQLRNAAANADKMGLDDYTAAMVAYELGQLHPAYGKAPNKTGSEDPKPNGGLTPEQMKRVQDNTQRRASSATVSSGSGRRTISAEDVDLATFAKFTPSQRLSFREKHPEAYSRLMRG